MVKAAKSESGPPINNNGKEIGDIVGALTSDLNANLEEKLVLR